MFANTKPDGGLVVVGQEDDGGMSGCLRSSTEHLNDLERTADNNCSDSRFEVKRISVRRPDGIEDFVMLSHLLPPRQVGKNPRW